MTDYVCGLYFNPERTHVALVRKKRPAWQNGLLNGVGGKKEPKDDDCDAAMVREFKEETGVQTPLNNAWQCFFVLEDERHNRLVYIYRAFGDLTELRREPTEAEDEAIEIWDVREPIPDIVPDLSWLIPMALDSHFDYGEGIC